MMAHSLGMDPRELLRLLMAERGLNSNSLSRATGNATKQPQIHRFLTGEAREPKRSTLAPIAEVLGVPVDCFFSEDAAEQVAAERNLTAVPDTQRGGLYVKPLAQQLSQAVESMTPTTIQWGSLLSQQLPSRFRLVLQDDSMTLDDPPSMREGHWAEFERSEEAPAGSVVLLSDGEGNVYIRKKVQKTPGRWEAHARRAADYLPLDSEADGLRILAVQVGQGWK
jgi:transcriptional regulator with XRE-family HTH domain